MITVASLTECRQITGTSCSTALPHSAATSANLQHIITIVIGTLAAVAVLMIVIAGFSFITAEGDPQKMAKARQSIIYALVGLGVVVSAEVIVTFVLGKAA